jgi:hypothetical protein
MWKRLLVVILVILVAVGLDLLYDRALQSVAETFDLQLSVTLFWMRPIILIAGYAALLIAGYPLITTSEYGNSLSGLLIAIGIALLYVTTFPPGSGNVATRDLYLGLVTLATSRLGLTVHVGAFLVAAGVVRFLRRSSALQDGESKTSG